MPPLTVAILEEHLDIVAVLMSKAGRDADLLLPIWRRVQLELKKRREADAILDEARARLTRARQSTDQTAARSA
ncbi:hypothetical protein [Mesorhizobium sp. B1-1-2]|uniref:hypothetical protein n=1 Tax=Mesorhizobium sp. B1-1-2 TaxID=2589982 RepID=UPI001128BBBB|nr:hypothetical protein [Mesorhizobium sp. B1-1-2]TPN79999.1 hypothetical protein FJ985_01845 [Mesorhizobium sp. B1-1-2]